MTPHANPRDTTQHDQMASQLCNRSQTLYVDHALTLTGPAYKVNRHALLFQRLYHLSDHVHARADT